MSVNLEVNKIKNIPNKVVNISMGDKRQLKPQHVSYGLRKETYTLSK